MGKDVDILIGCAEVFAAIGLKRASRMIVDYLENPNSDKVEIFQKEVEVWENTRNIQKAECLCSVTGNTPL